jgi:hypothetical protein
MPQPEGAMSVIEIEFREDRFRRILWFLLSAAPIPAPTLAPLGADRLIAGMRWGPVEFGAPPWLQVTPPGTLFVRSDVEISHVSLAELATDADATRARTQASAWLLVRATPTTLEADMFGLVLPDGHLRAVPSLRVGSERLGTDKLSAVGAAIIHQGEVVTVRLGTAATDNLLAPPVNRLDHVDNTFLLRVSGEALAERVLGALREATSPPPNGLQIEDQPSAAWLPTGLAWGGQPPQWGAVGNVGLKKPDACPGLFGDVDLSVAVEAVLTIQPDPPATPGGTPSTASMFLRIKGDASDWDIFRCWAGSGGLIASLLGILGAPLIGTLGNLAGAIMLGGYIDAQVSKDVKNLKAPAGFTKVSEDDDSVLYRGILDLTQFGAGNSSIIVDEYGLTFFRNPSDVVAADHASTPRWPDNRRLETSWNGRYDCKEARWTETVHVADVPVRDTVLALNKQVRSNLVTVFPTTKVEPAGQWRVEIPQRAIDPTVRVLPAGPIAPGDTGRLYLHTSAGILRLDLDPVPQIPERDPIVQYIQSVNCRMFGTEVNPTKRIRWLVDPPPGDFAHPPLRQWLVSIPRLAEGARLAVSWVRDGEETGRVLKHTADRAGAVLLELVTDAQTELALEHSLDVLPPGSRLTQRWLIPLHIVELPAPAQALARDGEYVLALGSGRVHALHRTLGTVEVVPIDNLAGTARERLNVERRRQTFDGPPYSLAIPGTEVIATAWEDRLVLALPWAGPSPRWQAGPVTRVPLAG